MMVWPLADPTALKKLKHNHPHLFFPVSYAGSVSEWKKSYEFAR